MEHPTKKEAEKELCWRIWEDEKKWDNLENYIHNTAEHLADIDPLNSDLYFAAITQDKLEEYFTRYYAFSDKAFWTRTFMVCKDCYDYLSCDNEGMVADIFAYYYGEEAEEQFSKIKKSVEKLEDYGKFWKEVPECVKTFSPWPCQCCGSTFHGERHFVLFEGQRVKK